MEILKYFYDDTQLESIAKLDTALYIKVNKDKTLEHYYISPKIETQEEIIDWFRMRNYYSKITNINKCMDSGKKILTHNNLNTFFFRDKIFYYTADESFSLEPLKQLITNFNKTYFSKFNKYVTQEEIDTYCNTILELLPKIVKIIEQTRKEYGLKDYNKSVDNSTVYVKIFFDETIENYITKSDYFNNEAGTFNVEKYNVEFENQLFGASSFSTSINESKKPFLVHNGTPFLVPLNSLKDVKAYKRLEKWLSSQNKRSGYISLNSKTHLLEFKDNLSNGEQGVFISFELGLTGFTLTNYYLCQGNQIENFDYKIFIPKRYEDNSYQNQTISLSLLEDMISKKFYNGYLINNYNKDAKDISVSDKLSSFLKAHLIKTRNAYYSFFKEGQKHLLKNIIYNYTFNLVLYKFTETCFYDDNNKQFIIPDNFKEIFNIYLNLKNYFYKEENNNMAYPIKDNYDKIIKNLDNLNDFKIENDEQYSIIVGQFVKYCLNKSKAKKLTYDYVSVFTTSQNNQRIRTELQKLLNKYSHELYINSHKFNIIIKSILEYETKNNFNNEACLYGIVSDNLFYMKKLTGEKVEETDKENNEENTISVVMKGEN